MCLRLRVFAAGLRTGPGWRSVGSVLAVAAPSPPIVSAWLAVWRLRARRRRLVAAPSPPRLHN
eukprot:1672156-Pyramimonas_sp.AAC.1